MIIHLQSSNEPQPIKCTQGGALYRVAFGVEETESGWEWFNIDFDHRPRVDEIRAKINEFYNTEVSHRIESGWEYNGTSVWLSTTNQHNYATSAQIGAEELIVKGGTDSEPVYITLSSAEEVVQFVADMQNYINECIAWGWERKDVVDYSVYE